MTELFLAGFASALTGRELRWSLLSRRAEGSSPFNLLPKHIPYYIFCIRYSVVNNLYVDEVVKTPILREVDMFVLCSEFAFCGLCKRAGRRAGQGWAG